MSASNDNLVWCQWPGCTDGYQHGFLGKSNAQLKEEDKIIERILAEEKANKDRIYHARDIK